MRYIKHKPAKFHETLRLCVDDSSFNYAGESIIMTDSDDLEWDEWNPTQISFVKHMIAGSVAGLAEHVTLFPIDTVKTHVQCERCGSASPFQTWNCAARIVHREGLFRLWRGVSAMFAACIPAHAAYFSVYESSKHLLGAGKEGHHPLQAAVCGALAALSHDLFMTPFDLAKQRLQLGYYRNVLQCMRSIAKAEGVAALYVGLPTTLIMNIPYGCIMMPVNESVRKLVNPSGGYSISASMIAGCAAGAVAAAGTNPLDVIKTRLQTQNLEPCPKSVLGMPIERTNPLLVLRNAISAVTAAPEAAEVVSSKRCGSSLEHPMTQSRGVATIASVEVASSTAGLSGGGSSNSGFKGIVDVARRIHAESGVRGFFRGVVPRVLTQAPAVAISWTAYESMKRLLSADAEQL